MNELQSVEKALRILKKVKEENTGSRKEFANYLGISPRWLTRYLRKIEQELKIEILYCRKTCTYYIPPKDEDKLPPQFRTVINYMLNIRGSMGIPNGVIFVITKPD